MFQLTGIALRDIDTNGAVGGLPTEDSIIFYTATLKEYRENVNIAPESRIDIAQQLRQLADKIEIVPNLGPLK